jgi:predicted enzyme related to lactoylglutathione lyase
MPIENALASLAVGDLAAATLWYARLFGRPADSRPMPQVAEWEFPRGGWLQLYESAERAGKGSLTLAVTDVEQQVAELQKCGLEAGQPIVTEKVKVVMIKDPDGNSIAFAEALDPSLAR